MEVTSFQQKLLTRMYSMQKLFRLMYCIVGMFSNLLFRLFLENANSIKFSVKWKFLLKLQKPTNQKCMNNLHNISFTQLNIYYLQIYLIHKFLCEFSSFFLQTWFLIVSPRWHLFWWLDFHC